MSSVLIKDTALAKNSGRLLARCLKEKQVPTLRTKGCEIELPASVLPLLLDILKEIGRGNSVAVIPSRKIGTNRPVDEFRNMNS